MSKQPSRADQIRNFLSNNLLWILLIALLAIIGGINDIRAFIIDLIIPYLRIDPAPTPGLLIFIDICVFLMLAWAAHYVFVRHNPSNPLPISPNRWLYILAVVVIVLLPALLVTGNFGYYAWTITPPTHTVVLIADFLDPSGIDSRRVTQTIVEQLQIALSKHPDIVIKHLNQTIPSDAKQGSDIAKAIALRPDNKAAMVIWGDYVANPEPELYVHFNGPETPEIARKNYCFEVQEQYGPKQTEYPSLFEFKLNLADHLAQLVAFTSALILMDSQHYKDALTLLDTAVQTTTIELGMPVQRYARINRGIDLLYLKRWEDAVTNSSFLIPGPSESDGDWDDISKFALRIRAKANESAGNYADALADNDLLLRLTPNSSTDYQNRGLLYSQLHNNLNAIKDFTSFIKLNPTNPVGYFNRASNYSDSGNFPAAIADLDQAIKLKPDYVCAYNNRGLAYRNQSNYSAAIQSFEKAITIEPDFFKAYMNRAATYVDMGNTNAAIQDISKALQLDPKNPEFYRERGDLRHLQKDLSGAVTDYNKAIELDPSNADSYYNRAVTYYAQGIFTKALSDLDKALQIDQNAAPAYNMRGIVHARMSDLSDAIIDFSRAIELDPQFAPAYSNRGRAHEQQGKITDALVDYHRYLGMNPNAKDRAQLEAHIATLEKQHPKP